MKNLLLIACLITLLTSCQKKQPLTYQEKILCGHWMTSYKAYNRERFIFKHDGTFTDIFDTGIIHDYQTAETWKITGNKLTLTYKNTFFLIPFHSNPTYRILTLNDSVLVLANKPTKHYPLVTQTFKKMKLHGKFIKA